MKGALVPSLILPLLAVAATEGRPPNIAILYADDRGIGDVGCYGCTAIATPPVLFVLGRCVVCLL